MLKNIYSPIMRIMTKLGRFYRTYRASTAINRVPKNSVPDPLVRHRDHDYEGVING